MIVEADNASIKKSLIYSQQIYFVCLFLVNCSAYVGYTATPLLIFIPLDDDPQARIYYQP